MYEQFDLLENLDIEHSLEEIQQEVKAASRYVDEVQSIYRPTGYTELTLKFILPSNRASQVVRLLSEIRGWIKGV